MEAFDQNQTLEAYIDIMKAGIEQHEEELTRLIQMAKAHGMYFEYDRVNRKHILIQGAMNLEEHLAHVLELTDGIFREWLSLDDHVPEHVSRPLGK